MRDNPQSLKRDHRPPNTRMSESGKSLICGMDILPMRSLKKTATCGIDTRNRSGNICLPPIF